MNIDRYELSDEYKLVNLSSLHLLKWKLGLS